MARGRITKEEQIKKARILAGFVFIFGMLCYDKSTDSFS